MSSLLMEFFEYENNINRYMYKTEMIRIFKIEKQILKA